MKSQHERECEVCWNLATTLGTLCSASPEIIVDKLTGYLWDEEEASIIKSNKPKE